MLKRRPAIRSLSRTELPLHCCPCFVLEFFVSCVSKPSAMTRCCPEFHCERKQTGLTRPVHFFRVCVCQGANTGPGLDHRPSPSFSSSGIVFNRRPPAYKFSVYSFFPSLIPSHRHTNDGSPAIFHFCLNEGSSYPLISVSKIVPACPPLSLFRTSVIP